MDGRPAEYRFNHTAIIGMDVYPFRRSYLMIGTAIADNVNEPIAGNVVYKPRNFIGVGFNYYFVWCILIDDAYSSAIVIYIMLVDIRFQVIKPKFLAFPFKACWRRVV